MDVDMVKLPKKLTPEEREQCAKKGLCFHCRKSGHMASTCPAFTNPKKPRIQCARKEEKLSELKEIEDDNDEEGVARVHFGLEKDF